MRKSENLSTTLIIYGVLLVVAVSFIWLILPSVLNTDTTLKLGDGVFRARIALNDDDRAKGLSGVKELAPDQALLMAYPSEGKWGIWMKGMNIPIDIVWLNKDKKVIFIVKNVSPEESTSILHQPKTPAKYVIEFPAGTVDAKAINTNSKASFQINPKDIK